MAQPKEKFTIVGIGEVLWDIYRDRRYLGGAPANFAIHAAQLGDEGLLVSRIGDDGMGRELIQALRQRRLPVEAIQIDEKKPTGTVMVSLDVKGVPSFRCSQ
ncbi:MAG: PfkB family carbohydrate kinase, partial [bacterium]